MIRDDIFYITNSHTFLENNNIHLVKVVIVNGNMFLKELHNIRTEHNVLSLDNIITIFNYTMYEPNYVGFVINEFSNVEQRIVRPDIMINEIKTLIANIEDFIASEHTTLPFIRTREMDMYLDLPEKFVMFDSLELTDKYNIAIHYIVCEPINRKGR